MKFSDLIPSEDQVESLRNIETQLFARKRNGKIAGNLAMILAIIQVLLVAWQYIKTLFNIGEKENIAEYLKNPQLYIPLILFTFLIFIYFILRRTSILLKETNEPFRYTFWVEPFKQIENSAGDRFKLQNADRFNLLHFDLTELIYQRIKRFSILQEVKKDQEPASISDTRKSSHIQIYGYYAVREDKENGEWIIHVMPYIRIGGNDAPATLAQSVKFPLSTDETPDIFDTGEYNQLLERVYSRITTEIYVQIEKDIRSKIDLFPTPYLQANALYHEAQDMANSNTINAFDSAIKLYEEAIHKMDLTLTNKITATFIKVPFLRMYFVQRLHQYARFKIGYAKCLVYKKRIAALSGRKSNPIFQIRHDLKEIIEQLEYFHFKIGKNYETSYFRMDRKTFSILAYMSFPEDSWKRRVLLKPSQSLFYTTRKILFDAYVVYSLTDTLLKAFIEARKYLDKAKAVAPDLSTTDVLYFLAEAYLEPNVDRSLLLFQQATEKDPSFQIAQYDFAYWTEMKFRINGEINSNRAQIVLKEYDKVLRINPGNIAALAAQGYILWLVKDLKNARRKFLEGCEIKSIISETFTGQLIYGLARIMAEQGKIYESYDLYNQAIASNPNVGTFYITDNSLMNSSFYDFITPELLSRYKKYHDNFTWFLSEKLFPICELDFNLQEKIKNNQIPDDFSAALKENGIDLTKECFVTEEQKRWIIKDKKTELVLVVTENSKVRVCLKPDLTDKIVKAVYSFILNDFGNASMNYYKRYGEKKMLDEAAKNYEKAVLNYPKNITAKYNYSLALNWKREPENHLLSGKILVEVIEDNPGWFEAISNYVESNSSEILEIAKLQHELFALTEKHFAEKAKPRTTYDLKKSEDKIAKLEAKIKGKVQIPLEDIRRIIIKNTKLISLYDGLQLDSSDFEKIGKLLKRNMNWYALNEDDVQALKIYAISYFIERFNHEYDISDKLFNLILDYYYPEDYDIYRYKNSQYQGDEKTSRFLFAIKAKLKLLDDLNILKFPSGLQQAFNEHNISLVNKTVSELEKNKKWLIGDVSRKSTNYFLEKVDDRLIAKRREADICAEIMESSLKNSLETDPINYTYLFDAETSLTSEDYLRYLKKAVDIDEDPIKKAFISNQIGNFLWKNNEFEKALPYYENASRLDTKAPIYVGNLAGTYLKMKNWDQAIEFYEKAIDLRKDIPDEYGMDYYYDFLAEASYKAGRIDEFLKSFSEMHDLDSEPLKKATVYNRVANLFFVDNRFNEAISHYMKAIELDNQRAIFYCNLGRAFLNIKNWKDALVYCQTALEKAKAFVQTDYYSLDYYYDYLSEASYRSGNINDFMKLFEASEDLLDEPAKRAVVYNQVGNLYFVDYKIDEAVKSYTKAIELDKDKAIYHCNLGRSYMDLKKIDEAITSIQRAIVLKREKTSDSYTFDYYYEFLAEACFKGEKLKKFLTEFKNSHDLDKEPEKKAAVYNFIGNLYSEVSKYQEAIPYYEAAIKLDPERPVYRSNLGIMYVNLNQQKEAIKNYEAAIELRKNISDDPYELDYYTNLLSEVKGQVV